MFIHELLRKAENWPRRSIQPLFIDDYGAPKHARANRSFQSIEFRFLGLLVAILVLVPALAAQQVQGARPETATLRGIVYGAAGVPVRGAHVALKGSSLRAPRETETNAKGEFTFDGMADGAFTLVAHSGSLRSKAVPVRVSSPGAQPPIDLVLSSAGAEPPASSPLGAGQAMQFADNPNFAIAAVTDWTAAGGHGSDAILRASEALNRDAVNLKPGGAKPGAAGSPGGAGRPNKSVISLLSAVEKDPNGFGPNHRLGVFYLQAGRYRDAIPPLQAAFQANPASYGNEYDLAKALKMAGDPSQARKHVRRLLARRPNAALHLMEGQLDETLGDPLSAVRQFQQAASENPSEENYFAWGSELLYHRAIWQAKEVFDEGVKLYPHSARMLTARGAALFAGALYDQAALDLCRASDLNPQSQEPYLFMGKIELAAPNPLPCVLAKLARFHKLQPANSLANYYYAMALWKQQGHVTDPQTMQRVTSLLTTSVTLDSKCADGYFALGNLSAERSNWQQAIDYYQKSIRANPKLKEAHYRLGVAYERVGREASAKEQFQLHDVLAREQAAAIQRRRKAVKQFLVVLPNQMRKQTAPQ